MRANVPVALVTGGAGTIGSQSVIHLLAEGFKVRALDLPSADFSTHLGPHLENPSLSIDLRDVLEVPSDDSLFANVDFLFHCAGIADPIPSLSKPEAYVRTNVLGVTRVLEGARLNGVKKVIYPSSAAVYGTAAWPTREDHPINPIHPYGLTKYMGELVLQHWFKVFRVPTLCFRIFNAYGPDATTGGPVGVFLRKKLAGEPLTILVDGKQQRDFIFITDVVEAVIRGAQSDRAGEVYNLATGNPQTIDCVAQLIGGDIQHVPGRPGEPKTICANISKIKAELKWTPRVSIEEGIERMLRHLERCDQKLETVKNS